MATVLHSNRYFRFLKTLIVLALLFHYVNVSVLIKFSQKTSVFTLIIISCPKNHMFGCVFESPRCGDSNTHPKHIILWRNIDFFTFYHFDSDPRFPPLLLYVRWKSGVTFGRRCFRDAPYFLRMNVKCLWQCSSYLKYVR